MTYVPRLVAPSLDNPCYYSDENTLYKDGYGMPNCTCYALGRWIELLGYIPRLCLGMAGRWYGYTIDGYERGSTPKLGAIACWGLNGSDIDGHVAVVEEIKEDSILCSNSAYTRNRSLYAADMFYLKTYDGNYNFNNYIFKGFIYLPDSKVSNELTELVLEKVTEDTATFRWNASDSISLLMYSLDDEATWKEILGYPTFTIEGLSPNTNYKMYLKGRHEGIYTDPLSISFTTEAKTIIPAITELILVSTTAYQATFKWNASDSISLLMYSLDNKKTWKEILGYPTFTIEGLTPKTDYVMYLKGKHNDTYTSVVNISFATTEAVIEPKQKSSGKDQVHIDSKKQDIFDSPDGKKIGEIITGFYDVIDTIIVNDVKWLKLEIDKWIKSDDNINTFISKIISPIETEVIDDIDNDISSSITNIIEDIPTTTKKTIITLIVDGIKTIVSYFFKK